MRRRPIDPKGGNPTHPQGRGGSPEAGEGATSRPAPRGVAAATTADRLLRPPGQLFLSSSSSSQYSEDVWRGGPPGREDSRGSEAGTTESWEFKSTLEAPIARLESLDELESSQVRGDFSRGICRTPCTACVRYVRFVPPDCGC